MGVADLIKFTPLKISSLDPEVVIELELQYQPDQGIEYSAPPNLAQSATPGSAAVAVQWVNPGPNVCRFASVIRSKHIADDQRTRIAALDALDAVDATLGRAPRLLLSWGEYEIEGFASVRKRITGWWPVVNLPRQVNFEIEIVAAAELSIEGSSGGTGETLYRAIVDGETFELLAQRAYGDPRKGDWLRRLNPGIVPPVAGDLVKVVERQHPAVQGIPRPSSPPYLDRDRTGDTWQPLVDEIARARGFLSGSLSWAAQAEVVKGVV